MGDALKYLWYSFYTSLAGMYWKPLVLSVSGSEGQPVRYKNESVSRIGPDAHWPRCAPDVAQIRYRLFLFLLLYD